MKQKPQLIVDRGQGLGIKDRDGEGLEALL
jgi:hypothetical protein